MNLLELIHSIYEFDVSVIISMPFFNVKGSSQIFSELISGLFQQCLLKKLQEASCFFCLDYSGVFKDIIPYVH